MANNITYGNSTTSSNNTEENIMVMSVEKTMDTTTDNSQLLINSKKISELIEVEYPREDDYFVVDNGVTTRKMKCSNSGYADKELLDLTRERLKTAEKDVKYIKEGLDNIKNGAEIIDTLTVKIPEAQNVKSDLLIAINDGSIPQVKLDKTLWYRATSSDVTQIAPKNGGVADETNLKITIPVGETGHGSLILKYITIPKTDRELIMNFTCRIKASKNLLTQVLNMQFATNYYIDTTHNNGGTITTSYSVIESLDDNYNLITYQGRYIIPKGTTKVTPYIYPANASHPCTEECHFYLEDMLIGFDETEYALDKILENERNKTNLDLSQVNSTARFDKTIRTDCLKIGTQFGAGSNGGTTDNVNNILTIPIGSTGHGTYVGKIVNVPYKNDYVKLSIKAKVKVTKDFYNFAPNSCIGLNFKNATELIYNIANSQSKTLVGKDDNYETYIIEFITTNPLITCTKIQPYFTILNGTKNADKDYTVTLEQLEYGFDEETTAFKNAIDDVRTDLDVIRIADKQEQNDKFDKINTTLEYNLFPNGMNLTGVNGWITSTGIVSFDENEKAIKYEVNAPKTWGANMYNNGLLDNNFIFDLTKQYELSFKIKGNRQRNFGAMIADTNSTNIVMPQKTCLMREGEWVEIKITFKPQSLGVNKSIVIMDNNQNIEDILWIKDVKLFEKPDNSYNLNWTQLTSEDLLNGATFGGSTQPYYYVDSDGRLNISGSLKTMPYNQASFILPSYLCPKYEKRFTVPTTKIGQYFVNIIITPSGEVKLFTENVTEVVYFDNIHFKIGM